MGMLKEFREFAMKGNVVDMAVGVIVGAAFGKIVSSLVADVITPVLGLLIGGVDFTGLKLSLLGGEEPVMLNYGMFLQSTFDFIIVAFCLFLFIKAMNRFRLQAEAKPPVIETKVSNEELILGEIRDILKKQGG